MHRLRQWIQCLKLLSVAVGFCVSGICHAAALFEITPESVEALSSGGAPCDTVTTAGKTWLRLTAINSNEAEVTLNAPSSAPNGQWDLSTAEGIHLRLLNPTRSPVTVRVMAMNPDANGLLNSCRNAVQLSPGQQKNFLFRLTRRPVDPTYAPFQQFYMYSKGINVRVNTLDPAHVTRLVISISGSGPAPCLLLRDILPSGEAGPAPTPFFPFIDQYGQYVHGDWPGKIYSDTDFADRVKQERDEQADWPGPADRDRYGGWAAGPKLHDSGFFYPAKYQGKWWLVDPAGRLFWSYGPTGVGFGGDVTPITDRQNWFVSLPSPDGPFGSFYHDGSGATYQYYQDRHWVGFDIQAANLLRKYGSDYESKVAAVSHDRLHSWGFNTIGNWSDAKVYGLHKTPYCVAIHYGSALIHFHMPDVFDPGWEPAVRRRMQQERYTTANDPWNIGYFIDNERWFGWRPRGAAIGEETMKNPPERKAKIKFVSLLQAKYGNIQALNAAWHTQHASWDALLAFQNAPDMNNPAVLGDCGDFGMLFAERYFTVCRSAVKAVAPDNLYLGSRFFGHTDPEVVRLASRYCDVISYNIYDNPPDGRVNQYSKIDAPILSSEWGIDSDPLQTPFADDSAKVPDPADRATNMTRYLQHALNLPNLVGAHFFQYRDQPLSGRPDGEAVLRGFVNVADTPNFELVQANRKIAYRLYQIRSGSN